jgi:hypothetical protein
MWKGEIRELKGKGKTLKEIQSFTLSKYLGSKNSFLGDEIIRLRGEVWGSIFVLYMPYICF